MSVSEAPDSSSKLPRVTIVTPAYNQAHYLAATIESVLGQDYPDLEYIVIDDGSTDGTADVLGHYGDVIHWERQENQGQASALNRGWSRASGEFIGYLSSDDLLKPGAVRECVNYLLDHPEVVLVYPDFELIDSRGTHIRSIRTPDYRAYDLRVKLVCQPGPGALFRKRCFEHVGGWSPALRQMPDYEYWLRLSHEGPFMRVPSILSASRVHEASQSFNILSAERAMEPLKVIDHYYNESGRAQRARYYTTARGRAHLLAARMLFRSDRFGSGFRQVLCACRAAPCMLCSFAFWRVLLSGLFGKRLYRSLFSTSRST